MPRSPKKILLQTQVEVTVGRQFDKLGRISGHKRAGYLRFIVEQHVAANRLKLRQPDPLAMTKEPKP